MATWPTITDDDGSGTTGTPLDNSLFGQIEDYIGGAWPSVAHSAGNFTSSAGSWTVDSGDQSYFSYVEIGKTMIVSVVLVTTSVSGTPTQLRVTVPNGRTIAGTHAGNFPALNNAVATTGMWQAGAGLTYIALLRDLAGTATWDNATNTTAMRFTATFQIA